MKWLLIISLPFLMLISVSWRSIPAVPISREAAASLKLVNYLKIERAKMFTRTAASYSPGEYLGVGVTSDGFGFVMTDALNLWLNSSISSATGSANLIGTATQMRLAVNNLHNANFIDINNHVWGGGQQCGNPYITGTNVYEENLDSAGNDRTFSSIANFWNNPDGEEGYTVGIEMNGTVWVCGDTRNGARGNGTAGADLQKWVQVPIPANIVPRKVYGAFAIFLLCDTTTSGGTVIGQRLYSWTNSGGRAASLGYGNPAFGAGASSISTYNVPTEILFGGQHAHNILCVSGGLDCNYALFDSAIAGRPDSTRLYCWGTYGWRMAHSTVVAQDNLNTPTDITSKVLTTAVKTAAASTQIDTVNTDNGSTHILVGSGSTRVLVGWGSTEQGTLGTGLQRNFATYTTPYNDGGQDEFNGDIVQFTPVVVCPGKTNWKTLCSNGFYGYYNEYQDQNGDWFFCGRFKSYVAPLGMHPGDYTTGNLSGVMNCGWQYANFVKQYDAFALSAAPTIGQGCSNACVGGPTTNSQCSAITVTCSSIHAVLSVTSAGATAYMNASSSTYGGTRFQHVKFYIDGVIAGGVADNPVNQTDTVNGVAAGSHTGKVVVQGQYFEADSTTFSFTISSQTDYYFSAAGSGTACGSSTPCAPSYIATVMPLLNPGNTVHLNRGDAFPVEMFATVSGSSGNPITITAYGTGADPVLGGMGALSGWTNTSGNLWSASWSGPAPTLLTINGVLANKSGTTNGYQTFIPASGSTTDLHFISNPFSVADSIAGKCTGSNFFAAVVTATTATDATIAPAMPFNNAGGNGAFKIGGTPTKQGEWNLPSAATVQIYSVGAPTGVAAPNVGIPLTISGNYIDVSGIAIKGCDTACIVLSGAHDNVTGDSLQDGMDWIWTTSAVSDTITNNYVAHFGNGMRKTNFANFNNVWENNSGYDIGMIPGMGTPGNAFQNYCFIIAGDSGGIAKFNYCDSVGYCGIANYGHQFKADSNIIHKPCQQLPDGGGVYTWVGSSTTFRQREIIGNLVDSAGSAAALAGTSLSAASSGIYLDNWSSQVSISGGGLWGNAAFNFYDHGPTNTVTGIKTYSGGTGEIFIGEPNGGSVTIINLILKNNQIGASRSGGLPIWIFTSNNDLATFGTIDSNAYISYRQLVGGWKTQSSVDAGTSRGIVSWQGNVGYDIHSSWMSGQTQFLTGGSAGQTYTLTGLWQDANGAQYHGTITVPAYQSLLLIRNDLNSITIPKRKISLIP